MKRILSMIMVMVMVFGISAMANEKEVVAVPTLISAEVKAYTIDQDGSDVFSVVVEENASTGYTWTYTIDNSELLEFVEETIVADESGLVGAPSKKTMTFKVLGKGVSTVLFESKRSFGDEEAAESFELLAYKSDTAVIIEENQTVYALDVAVPVLYDEEAVPVLYDGATKELYNSGVFSYLGETVEADVQVQVVDGVTMVPLRATLEAMGYEVTWNNETRSVEIQKGAQWTSITVGKNAYFRNRMAAHELSSAPVIKNNRTLVPVEFFVDIIGAGLEVEEGKINFLDMASPVFTGYVKSLEYDETGALKITITNDLESEELMDLTIIHTSKAFTFTQKELAEGDMVSVITSMVMTSSIPGQTSGYVVY